MINENQQIPNLETIREQELINLIPIIVRRCALDDDLIRNEEGSTRMSCLVHFSALILSIVALAHCARKNVFKEDESTKQPSEPSALIQKAKPSELTTLSPTSQRPSLSTELVLPKNLDLEPNQTVPKTEVRQNAMVGEIISQDDIEMIMAPHGLVKSIFVEQMPYNLYFNRQDTTPIRQAPHPDATIVGNFSRGQAAKSDLRVTVIVASYGDKENKSELIIKAFNIDELSIKGWVIASIDTRQGILNVQTGIQTFSVERIFEKTNHSDDVGNRSDILALNHSTPEPSEIHYQRLAEQIRNGQRSKVRETTESKKI